MNLVRSLRLLLLGAVVAAACDQATSTPIQEDTCAKRQPLTNGLLDGQSLAAKQLALTFDDGPGTRTAELSAYLKSQGIRAAFFVNGQNVPTHPGVLAQLVADGHVVGNHTQTHPDLTSLQPAQMVTQLAQTDAIIAPYVPNDRFMFRAPFGAYDANVYNALQASAMSKYVGHIDWEFGGTAAVAADWACWQQQSRTSKDCGDRHVAEIAANGQKGIVLFHDADYGNIGNTNVNAGIGNTIDMVKYMVPILKAANYTFVRLDEVPAIAALLPPLTPDAGAPDAATDATDAATPPVPTTTTTTPPPPPPPPPDPCAK